MQDAESEFSLKQLFHPFTTMKAVNYLIIIGLLVLGNGLFNGFAGDDQPQITDSMTIRSISNFPQFFSGSTFYTGGGKLGGMYYKPLLNTSYALIYSMFGPSAFLFHFFQIILHIANACLLFFLFRHWFKQPSAFFLALIFLVHPINSESAFYISDLQETLFFFFGITALLVLLKWQQHKSYLAAVLLLLFSLLSKETGILSTAISILYMLFYYRKKVLNFLWYIAGMLFLYFVLRVSAIGLVSDASANAPIMKLAFAQRLINTPSIVLFYFRSFFFPLNLSVSYHWAYSRFDLPHVLYPLLLDLLIAAVIIFIGIKLYRKHSRQHFFTFLFFTSWLVLGLALHSQIIPLDKTVAERWFYFSSVGAIGMAGVLMDFFKINLAKIAIMIFASILLLLLSTRTFIRSFDWRNDKALIIHDLKVSPDAYDLENELSHIYFTEGNYKEAKIHALKSISLYPYMTNYTNLGAAETLLGNNQAGKKAYLEAMKYGNFYIAYENYCALAVDYGDPKENRDFIRNVALLRYPQDWKIWLDLALIEYKLKNISAAQNAISRAYALDRNPQTENAYQQLMSPQIP